jgi:hypothetical protein
MLEGSVTVFARPKEDDVEEQERPVVGSKDGSRRGEGKS